MLHPSYLVTPNAETIAAMNGVGEDGRQPYDSPEAKYKDLRALHGMKQDLRNKILILLYKHDILWYIYKL